MVVVSKDNKTEFWFVSFAFTSETGEDSNEKMNTLTLSLLQGCMQKGRSTGHSSREPLSDTSLYIC